MAGLVSFFQQAFPGQAELIEKDVPDLTGKVIIVTGSNTGLGKELAQILYSKNAKIYMMARSQEKTLNAIEDIKTAVPKSSGELAYIHLDLADLPSIKNSAQEFLSKESRLDLLFNNAGVAYPERGSTTKQGYETQLGVNCIGTFALTKHLTSTLISTAKTAPTESVRVIWVSSSAAEGVSPKNYMENLSHIEKKGSLEQYCMSKLGNYFHATEFAARHKADGVISVSLNPGNLDSELWRTQGTLTHWFLRRTLLHPTIYGAYTNLFAAFSPKVTLEKSGSFIAPWGRFWNISNEMVECSKTEAEGGNGTAREFWEWNEEQVRPYL